MYGHLVVICVPEAHGTGMLQAQVMKGRPADARMEGVHRPSPSSIPVMFFGTLEIAWVSPGDLTAWREGIQAKLHTKPKGRKAFESSLREVGTAEPSHFSRISSVQTWQFYRQPTHSAIAKPLQR